MLTLLFLSRVTFLYNLCMIATLLVGYFNIMPDREMNSSIIVAGLFLAIVFNGLIHLWAAALLIRERSVKMFTPAWLFVVNFLCFLYQIYMLLK